ncbi:MAG: serine protease [Bacteroidales bacterium]|jgi:hypothetical protein|nr:serine protease [Bacteroidales bacterium]
MKKKLMVLAISVIAVFAAENANGQQQYGTCFALSSDGYIATAYHIIADEDGDLLDTNYHSFYVKGVHGDLTTKYSVAVIAVDKANDIALLKIKDANFKSLSRVPLGLKVSGILKGEKICVIGFPNTTIQGSEAKVTEGLINSLTGLGGANNQYQFSAEISTGNSGGPLLDMKGNILGIVSSYLPPEFEFDYINYKYPVTNVNYAIKSSALNMLIESYNIKLPENKTNMASIAAINARVKDYIYIIEVIRKYDWEEAVEEETGYYDDTVKLTDLEIVSEIITEKKDLDLFNDTILTVYLGTSKYTENTKVFGKVKKIREQQIEYVSHFGETQKSIVGDVIITYYNKDANPTKIETYNNNGDLNNTKIYSYDKNNRCDKIELYDNSQFYGLNLYGKIIYNRDNAGNIITALSYYYGVHYDSKYESHDYTDGFLLQKMVFSYNKDNECYGAKLYYTNNAEIMNRSIISLSDGSVKITSKSGDDVIIEDYIINNYNQLTEYNKEVDGVKYTAKLEYSNSKTKQFSKMQHFENDRLYYTLKITYDKNNNILTYSLNDETANMELQFYKMEYTYDKKGNWIECKQNDDTYYEREIEYYD